MKTRLSTVAAWRRETSIKRHIAVVDAVRRSVMPRRRQTTSTTAGSSSALSDSALTGERASIQCIAMTHARKPPKTGQLNLRISEADRANLERAAELVGLPLSALVLQASLDHAQQVLREHSSLVVRSDLFDALLSGLDAPARELPVSLSKAFDQLDSVVETR
jgi:uncharacterized protein (DUF1778 family)